MSPLDARGQSGEAAQAQARAAQAERSRRYAELARARRFLPEKISPFYRRKLEEEFAALGSFEGPLSRGALASEDRLTLSAPNETADWVDDRSNIPAGGEDSAIQKYADRVLFTPTSICAAHCLYCFRQDILAERHDREDYAFDERLRRLEALIDSDEKIREVVISGGDPLTLPAAALRRMLEAVSSSSRPHLRAPRVHSRAPIFAPQSLTPAKLAALGAAKARLVLHVVHPYEICAEVEAGIEAMRKAGIRLYNQFPLLRGVNDRPEVLARIVEKLDELGVRTLSVFVPEPIHGSAAYRVRLERIAAIWRQFRQTNPSWITAIRLALDSPLGKVQLEDLLRREGEWAVFQRLQGEIRYPDFPAELDRPGNLETLLWKG